MKTPVWMGAALMALVLTGCGGGGGGGSTVASAPEASPPEASSSSSESSVSSESSSSSSVASSIESRFPDYNASPAAPDATGMDPDATAIAADMRVGLNIGNTLEAMGGQSETYWGNPRISPEFVAYIEQAGFNAVRLPVSWDQYADAETAAIDEDWLARVEEVVQYCVDNDLYVIVNAHWDGGWLEENVTPEQADAVNDRHRAYWQQIATRLRDFDHRVLFAGANEPDVETAEQMAVLERYHQTFVDAVRATGGRNAYRTLVVQGPKTDIETTNELMGELPSDSATGRMMVEVHFYSPWNYTGMQEDQDWGNRFFYWGEGYHSPTDTAHNPTWGEEAFVDEMFASMNAQFVQQGIPVVLGEFGTGIRDELSGENLQLHLDGRAYYFHYITERALEEGMLPFYWDIGELLDRSNPQVLESQAYQGLMDAADEADPYWANQPE